MYTTMSLAGRINWSDVVVRASLESVSPGTETIQHGEGVAPTYRPTKTFRFMAREYLKGQGTAEVAVVIDNLHEFGLEGVASDYLDEADAARAASAPLIDQDAARHEAVLFLEVAHAGPVRPDEAMFVFLRTGGFRGNGKAHHEFVHDLLDVVWLVAQGETDAVKASGGTTYTTDREHVWLGSSPAAAARSSESRTSLADLRSKVTEHVALLRKNEHIEGFDDCITSKIKDEETDHSRQILRAYGLSGEPRQGLPVLDRQIASGAGAGTVIKTWDRTSSNISEPHLAYSRRWLEGPDADLFRSQRRDDDGVASTGYYQDVVAARPLPAGDYTVDDRSQSWEDIPCNYDPGNGIRWRVTAVPPADALHEAFFDPAAIGAVVGADSGNGTLEPRPFTASGAQTALEWLRWDAGTVRLELSQAVSLAHHVLDFITLDGTIALSLSVADAAVSGGTLTWAVAEQPWRAGDQLMLRIRQAGGSSGNL